MTGPIVQIEGGMVTANLEDRTITGRLIPIGEEGRTNIGRFTIASADDIDITDAEADPSIISHNLDHQPHQVVARATRVWKQPDGVYATYAVAKTKAGDEYLADVTSPAGKRKALSGEFGPCAIKDGKLVPGTAVVWGSAGVERGAFPSAMVLASDTPDEEEDLPSDPDEDEATPATPEEEEKESEVDTTTIEAGAEPTAAEQVRAAQSQILPANTGVAQVKERPVALRDVFAAIAAVKLNPSNGEARQVLAALTDIKFSGSNSLPSAGVLQQSWVGQLYDGVPYQREYITLGTLGTSISAAGKKGFKVNRGTSGSPIAGPSGIPNGGTWAGNKTEINSYNGWTETVQSSLRKFAVGHDIAREFFDLPGGDEVVEAFLKLVVEDYMYWSDTNALYDIQYNASAPVAAATYPSAYPASLGMLIQGILAVKARKSDGRRDVPNFAIANDLAYAELVYAAGGETNLPAFIDINVGTDSSGSVDGNVRVVQGDTGIQATKSVIVGASSSIQFDELPGGPLVIDALNIALGGVDRAVHGYLQTFVNRAEALVRIGTADAFAQSTAFGVGRILVYSGTTYVVSTAGTTAASNPSPPAVGATVTSGTAVLTRIA
jgi:hypothetical protein